MPRSSSQPSVSSANAKSKRPGAVCTRCHGIPYRTVPGDGLPSYFARGSGHNDQALYSERADDYVKKPFEMPELIARVRAALRRTRGGDPTGPATSRFGPLSIDLGGRTVSRDGAEIPLTRTEFDLLAVLSERPRMAFSRRQLIEAVWGPAWVGDEHLVDVHIGHLRRKLDDDAAGGRFVRTVRGIGYRMGTGQ